MRERRRVCHLITRLELGGAQQNTLFSTAHHDRARFSVSLWAGRGGILDDEARAILETDLRLLPFLRHPISPVADAIAVVRLAAMLRASRIELLHTHSSKAGIVGRLAAALAGTPAVVHTVHGWSFNDTQAPALRRLYVALERLAARRTHALVFVAEADRARGADLAIGDPARYRLFRSGIDRDRYVAPAGVRDATRRALGYGPDEVVVGSLACLKAQKAPLDFVAAADVAARSDPRLRFFIAGDGELRGEVEREVASRGLEDRFRLLGWRQDVAELLAAMDVFVLTSRFEGLPRAVLQAMAAGVPVVATAVGGTPEVVRDGATGRLVPPGEPRTAAAAILGLAADPELRRRCVAAARARLGEEFDIRRMVAGLDDLYLSLLEKPKTT
ncbi:MAG TPA: glycosyltransferase family 4 protein [Candidatus Polarisedimenticolaceae bacterium]